MGRLELLKERAVFEDYLSRRAHQLSVYHFSSVFLWQEYFEYTFEVLDDYLCVLASHKPGTFLYLAPLGVELNPKIIAKTFARLNELNPKKSFSRIENVAEEDLKHFDPERYKITEKSKDYCYFKTDLIDLKGNAYKSKRSSFNQFVNRYAHEFVNFGPHWDDDCLQLYDLWAKSRAQRTQDDIYKAMLEENRGVHKLIRRYYDELGLQGRVVLVDGKPQAYTFGYPLNEQTFCVLVEITNLQIKGLSVYVFNRFCADSQLKQFQWINVMDDFAMDNIARTKESYHPKKYHSSYVVTERE